MGKLKYYFTDHWGKAPLDAEIVLYEIIWNNYGFHGIFEFKFKKKVKFQLSTIQTVSICRIDGKMKKRHELRDLYSQNEECCSGLNDRRYISFPSKDLCLCLLLNFSPVERQQIARSLCFNFGEGHDFEEFKTTEQYRVSILRNSNEVSILESLKECKRILFCDVELNNLLDRDDIIINKSI